MAVRPAKPKPKPRTRARVPGYANQMTPMQRMRLPVDAELLWTGARQPNPGFTREGYGQMTPVNVGGQWQMFGTRTDPVGAAARPTLDRISADRDRAQRWATEQVAPWASTAFGNLANLNTSAQTGFANALGRGMTNIGNLSGSTAPPAYAGTEGLASPNAVDTQAGNMASAGRAQGMADVGAINAAVSSLGQGATAQAQIGALGAQIANIPRAYDERAARFMESLVPVRLQLDSSRQEREQARQQWLSEFSEGSRRFDQQMQQEAQLTGLKVQEDQRQFDLDLVQDQNEFNTRVQQDQSKRTEYTEKEARAAGGRGFWNRRPAKAPKGTSLVQAADTGKWVAIPAGGKGAAGSGSSAAAGRYASLRKEWSTNATRWMTESQTTTTDEFGESTRKTPPRFKDPLAFWRGALAAGLNVADAYKITWSNVTDSKALGPDPTDVLDELRSRNPRMPLKQLRERVKQITGKYPPGASPDPWWRP